MDTFTRDEIGMLWAALALYMEKGFPFKGGSREEHKSWQILGRQTWEKVKEMRTQSKREK